MPRKNLIHSSINLSSDTTFGSSILIHSPLINCFMLFTASGTSFINSGIIEIIEETNKKLIPVLLICKLSSCFITSFVILFPRAIDSNSRWCFSSSFVRLLAQTTEAVVPAADTNAEIPLITKGINANRGNAFHLLLNYY